MSKKQADVNEVINSLATQVAELTTNNAVLTSIVAQYEKEDTKEPKKPENAKK